jgi:DNA-binding NarL/FixJ family response regulator
MIELVIADDHAIVRSGLKQLFAQEPDLRVVAEATHGSETMDCVRQHQPDLLLLDLNMPGISGPDLIQRLKLQQPRLPILVLSMHNEPLMASRTIKAGATGYVTKDSEPEILIAAIRKVATGGKYIVPELAAQMLFDHGDSADAAPHTLLSNRELEIFRLLTTGKTANDIAAQLAISNKTVSTHKTRMMEKLKLGSTAELMRYAMQHGLVDGLPPDHTNDE